MPVLILLSKEVVLGWDILGMTCQPSGCAFSCWVRDHDLIVVPRFLSEAGGIEPCGIIFAVQREEVKSSDCVKTWAVLKILFPYFWSPWHGHWGRPEATPAHEAHQFPCREHVPTCEPRRLLLGVNVRMPLYSSTAFVMPWLSDLLLLQNSLVVEIPPFRNQRITSPVQVNFYVCNGKRKRSQYQLFTYLPANGNKIYSLSLLVKMRDNDDYLERYMALIIL